MDFLRPVTSSDTVVVAEFFRGKRILVTGGTGSFGHFIVQALLRLSPKEVRVLSRDEKKQHDMRHFFGSRTDLRLLIGDVRDYDSVSAAVSGTDIVFHAAALKQVPTCERFPLEAIRTNTLGAANVLRAALKANVSSVVAISTDKAVKPVNAMGLTKALQEKMVLEANRSLERGNTRCACVRYGNVLGSRGSVIPLFRRQLRQKKPLTLTDVEMTRFLLTLGDAIDLVLFAAAHAGGGEIYVRKAPAARLLDLATVVAEKATRELSYEVIGKLPGEKMHEILVSEEETERTQDMGDYYCIWPATSNVRLETLPLSEEYSSKDAPLGLRELRQLLDRADDEFEAMAVPDGEFSHF